MTSTDKVSPPPPTKIVLLVGVALTKLIAYSARSASSVRQLGRQQERIEHLALADGTTAARSAWWGANTP